MIGYEMFGNGAEKILVFHGWGLDHSAFASMYPALDTQTFTFAFMDYRGCGLSKNQNGLLSIEEIGKDAIELADHLKWNTFHLIGHSMGGMVVQWVASEIPSRIKSAVAVTPVPACGSPQIPQERRHFLLKAGDSAEGLAMFFMAGTANRHNMAWAKSMAEKSLSITDHEVYAKYTLAWADTNFLEKVMGVKVPLKVLVGDHDTITAEMIEQTILKWFPNSELEVLSNCGHYPMFEIPINLASICQDFMGRHK
jgi:pimeloyl-ACP methyl ester carboxylesterase